MSKSSVKKYKINNETGLNFYEVINRINKIISTMELSSSEAIHLFAFSDGIMFYIQNDYEDYNIRLYKDSKYINHRLVSLPEKNLKKVPLSE